MSDSLHATEVQSASHAVAPRVSLAEMEKKIRAVLYTTGDQIGDPSVTADDVRRFPNLAILTVCIVVMENGFMLVGKSAPASPENFNAEYGKQLAYEDCIRQLWKLEGYALRDRLSAES